MHGVFDIVGPIMIGTSSSHTAGADRVRVLGRKIFGGKVIEARVYLDGSVATGFWGSGLGKGLDSGKIRFWPWG